MGHKVHPTIYRLPLIYTWDSKWYARKDKMPLFLKQEIAIRDYLEKKLKGAGVDAIGIERGQKELTVNILAAKPGVIIGRSGTDLDVIRKHIEKKILAFTMKVKLNIMPLKSPALSAQVVGQGVVEEIENRMPFRRVMKKVLEKVMAAGAKGVKIKMSGRLNGAEIARSETLSAGKMSLITLRSDVDYAIVEANTLYGKIGIKVWVYHGEAFGRKDKFEKKEEDKKVINAPAPKR